MEPASADIADSIDSATFDRPSPADMRFTLRRSFPVFPWLFVRLRGGEVGSFSS
jgi:hypothetical protein